MTSLWPSLALLFPALAAYRIAGRATGGPLSLRIITGIILWTVLLLAPVHLLGALELAGAVPGLQAKHVALLAAAALLAVLARTRRAAPADTSTARMERPATEHRLIIGASAAVLGLVYLLFFAEALTSFPRSWDGIWYRLPLVVRWLQDGSLAIPESGHWRWSLPGNVEIVAWHLLATGWQPLASLASLPAALLLAVSAFRLGLEISGRTGACLAAVCAMSLPIILFQSFSNYVDMNGTAFLMASAALFCVSRRRDGERRWITLSGLACGVAIGSKPTFWAYGAFLAVIFGAVHLLRRDRVGLARAALFALGAAIPSVFWFGRGLFTHGSPLYPCHVPLPGTDLPGIHPADMTPGNYELNFVSSTWEWIVYPWVESKKSGFSFSTGGGLGAVFAAFVPLGLLFAARTVARDLVRRRTGTLALFAAALAAGTALWLLGLQRVPRFGVPLLVFACIVSAPLLERLATARRTAFAVVWISALGVTCVIESFIPSVSLAGRIRDDSWSRHEFYEIPALLDELPPGTIVANATTEYHKNFALAGKTLTNRVIPDWEIPGTAAAQVIVEARPDYIVTEVENSGVLTGEDIRKLGYVAVPVARDDSGLRLWKQRGVPAGLSTARRAGEAEATTP